MKRVERSTTKPIPSYKPTSDELNKLWGNGYFSIAGEKYFEFFIEFLAESFEHINYRYFVYNVHDGARLFIQFKNSEDFHLFHISCPFLKYVDYEY